MPSSPWSARLRSARLAALITDLGSCIQRGGTPREPAPLLPTGLAAVDRLLGGGFPRGRLCEIVGRLSSGRTALARAALAAATRADELAALVDVADAFDPASAASAGVELERLLWVRARGRTAWHSVERLLEAGGFALVLLDLPDAPMRGEAPLPASAWIRLARRAAASATSLVIVSAGHRAGLATELALETQRLRSEFSDSPGWLEGLETRIRLVRHRRAPDGRSAPLRLSSAFTGRPLVSSSRPEPSAP